MSRADNFITFMSRLSRSGGASYFWSPQDLSRILQGLLCYTECNVKYVSSHSSFPSCRPTRFNRLTPNDPYMGRTAPLTSKRCILYIYSTNIGTEYFKHALHYRFFFSSKCSLFHNANLFGSCIIHILYIGCAEIKLCRLYTTNK